jgi:purine-binding chemotaxis protein CheW
MSAHVCIALGFDRYAIAVEHVREVTELGTVVPVPGAGPRMAGIRHLHGEILPVVRLRNLLGAPAGNARRLVVVHEGDSCAGLAVDRADAVEDLPEPDEPGDEPWLRGTVEHDGVTRALLDVPAILDAVRAR